MLRRKPPPHPRIHLQVRLIRLTSNRADPRTVPASKSPASGKTARPYAYSVRAVVPAVMARRSTGLGEQERQAFVQALREGIGLLGGSAGDDESRGGRRELWAGDHHSPTLVAHNPSSAIQWEIRGFNIKLSHDQAEQLVATLETVPVLVQQMVRKNEDTPS